jgi:hypothetical protein
MLSIARYFHARVAREIAVRIPRKMSGMPMLNRAHAGLFGILLLALVLRLWAIDFGLPYQYHQDEGHEVYRALRLGKGDFDFDRNFKGGYFYLLFIEYALYYLVLRATGAIVGLDDFAVKIIFEPTPFWLIGRLTTAIIGTLSVYALYRLGKKVYDERVGLLAALFLAVAVIHAECSHYITVDVPMTLCLILAFSALIDVIRENSLRPSLRAGLLIGLAMLFKASAALAIIPFIFAHFQPKRRGRAKTAWMGNAGWGLASLMAIYLIGNPGLSLNQKESISATLNFIFGKSGAESDEIDPVFLMHYSDGAASLWRYYFTGLENSFGAGLLALSLAGVLLALWQRRRIETMMLSFLIPGFIVISASKTLTGYHYLMPLLPLLAILAARFAVLQFEKLATPRLRLLALGLLLLMTIQPLYRCAAFNARLTRPDTRSLAKEWVEKHIPAGTKIVIDKGRYRSHWAPPLEESAAALQRMLAAADDPGKREFLQQKLRHLSGVTYDLISTVWGTKVESLDDYKTSGVKYFVISEDVRVCFLRPNVKRLFPTAAAFYDALDSRADVVLISIFDPDIMQSPGPCIKIYGFTGSSPPPAAPAARYRFSVLSFPRASSRQQQESLGAAHDSRPDN